MLCVRYCDAEHAKAHQSEHQTECAKVVKLIQDIADTQQEMLELEEHPSGDAWEDREQIDYLRNRSQSEHCLLADELTDVDTLDAYSMALDAGCRYLTCFPGDEDGVHYGMAVTMLQLDMDQAYRDFMRWWSIDEAMRTHAKIWQSPALFQCSKINADVFERPPFTDVSHHRPVFLAICILLKMKVAIDLKNIHVKYVPRSVISERFLRSSLDEVYAAMKKLSIQISRLGQELHGIDIDLSQTLLRNRNMLKSLRRRKQPCAGNTGNEWSDRLGEEYYNVAKVYCAYQQTSEVFQILRMVDSASKEGSNQYSIHDPWAHIVDIFDAAVVRDAGTQP